MFDLTSEQFGEETLNYENNPEQFREVHLAKEEKRRRYEFLKEEWKRIFEKNIETTESRYFGMEELPTLAEEKNNEEQIRMCLEAYRSDNWVTLLE